MPRFSVSTGMVFSALGSCVFEAPGLSCSFIDPERLSSIGYDGAVLRYVCLSVGIRFWSVAAVIWSSPRLGIAAVNSLSSSGRESAVSATLCSRYGEGTGSSASELAPAKPSVSCALVSVASSSFLAGGSVERDRAPPTRGTSFSMCG